MKKKSVRSIGLNVRDFDIDAFYNDMSRDWKSKAAQLQVRRWRKLKHESTSHGN